MKRVRKIIRTLMEITPSAIHMVVPFFATLIDPLIAISLTICYVYYQFIDYVNNEKPVENQVDIIEWMAGLTLALIVRILL